MTKEEAIRELNTFKIGAKSELGETALEMAIKALEQEPKIGHREWVSYGIHPDIGNWHCSQCRTIIPYLPRVYKYCPHCGVRLEDEEV